MDRLRHRLGSHPRPGVLPGGTSQGAAAGTNARHTGFYGATQIMTIIAAPGSSTIIARTHG